MQDSQLSETRQFNWKLALAGGGEGELFCLHFQCAKQRDTAIDAIFRLQIQSLPFAYLYSTLGPTIL